MTRPRGSGTLEVSESKFSLNGCNVNVRRSGSGEKLLFLHGPQGLGGWPEALQRLATQYDVIVPDLPGFGGSDCPDTLCDVDDLGYFFLDFLKAQNLDGVHIVGHSLGGWVALEMAVRSTREIKSLTLVDSAGLRVVGTPRADMFICPPDELARLLHHGDAWKDFHAYWSSQENVDRFDQNRQIAAKFCWQPRLFNPRLERWLHRVDAPTHIVWGAEDKVIPLAYGQALRRLISAARLTTLPGVGHLSYMEQPAPFVEAVGGFIKGLAR